MRQRNAKKFKQHKHYLVGAGGLPKSLIDILYYIPKYFDPTKHPLSPYLDEQIIPKPGLDILLLQDFEDYLKRACIPPDYDAFYLALPHCYCNKSATKSIEILKKEYGITTLRAAFFPDKKIRYRTLIHELLHDTFNNLTNASRKKLLDSAFVNSEKIKHKNTTNWRFIPDLQLGIKQNLFLLDELISYSFGHWINTSFLVYSPSKPDPDLPKEFKKTMRVVGYKV